MTQEQHRTLTDYVRLIADGLGLRDWTFEVMEEPSNVDSRAQTNVTEGKKHARIWVAEDFTDSCAEMQRVTIIHELLHWHLWNADDIIEKDLLRSGWLTNAQHLFIMKAHQRQNEFAVDGIAVAIAQFYPLINWSNHESDAGEQLLVSPAEAGTAGEVHSNQGEGEGVRHAD